MSQNFPNLPPLNIPSPPGSRRGSFSDDNDDFIVRLPSPEEVQELHREWNYPELERHAQRMEEIRRMGLPNRTSSSTTAIYTPEENIKIAIKEGNLDRLKSFKKDLSKIQPEHHLLHYAVTYGTLMTIVWLLGMGYEEEFPGSALLLAINPLRPHYMNYMKDAKYPTESLRVFRWLLGNTQLYPRERVN